MPKGIKGFQKGNTGRPKGSRNRATLLQEERRAIFENQVSQRWEEVINELPPTYIADQYLGKAPEKIEHSGEIKTGTIPAEALAIIEADLKKKKTNIDDEI